MAAKDKDKQAEEGDTPSGDPADEPGSEETTDSTQASDGEAGSEGSTSSTGDESDESDEGAPAGHLGAGRYVMTGFFLTIIAGAYVLGRTLSALWGRLAEAAWFQKSAAALARVGEEERGELCIAIGAAVALGAGIHAYRRPEVRQWTDEVASELSKVTWPDKNEVTNSTIIVIVTSAFATFYLALLDRFWGFVTNLVYGS